MMKTIMDMDISAVETGTADALALINSIPTETTHTIYFATEGYDDAVDKIKEIADIVLEKKGGDGCFREFVDKYFPIDTEL